MQTRGGVIGISVCLTVSIITTSLNQMYSPNRLVLVSAPSLCTLVSEPGHDFLSGDTPMGSRDLIWLLFLILIIVVG
jgi:hypothetical protein